MATIKAEELIEEVKKYPVLYDPSVEQYRNSDYKDAAWKKIAYALNVEGQEEECKKRWGGIRDSLRRSRQKRKTKGLVYKYKYEELLDFVVPYIKAPNDEVLESHNEQHNSMMDIFQPNFSNDGSEQSGRIDFPQADTTPANLSRHKRKFETNSTSSQQPKKKIKPKFKHPVDAFLAALSPPLKSLNPFLMHEAKGKIFSIVQDLELQQLRANGQQGNMPYFPTIEIKQETYDSSTTYATSEEDV